MVNRGMRSLTLAICFACVFVSGLASQDPDSNPSSSAEDTSSIDGLWSGFWGGGERDGVVFQPVLAELVIEGDRVEIFGFRNVEKLAGTVRFDASARRMQITPAPAEDGQRLTKVISFSYEIQGEKLTLVEQGGFSVTLNRVRVARAPLANVQVEFFATRGIDDAGDLLVTGFRELQAGRAATRYFQPENRTLKTKKATVLWVQESGCKKVTVDEARLLISELSTVAVAYRDEDRTLPRQSHKLWKDTGSPLSDHEAVWQSYSRNLRPGTLVFVLSSRENVPQP
jgi:hypothetical protein